MPLLPVTPHPDDRFSLAPSPPNGSRISRSAEASKASGGAVGWMRVLGGITI